MKIAAILPLLPNRQNTGGVGYGVHRLCNKLVERGHDVTLVSLNRPPTGARYEVRRLPGAEALLGRRLTQLYLTPWRLGKHDFRDFDLIHAHGGDHFMFANRVPVVRTFWGSALGEAASATSLLRGGSQLVSYPLEWLSGILATESVAISRATARHLPFIRKIIPCGVDLTRYRPGMTKSERPSILYVAGTLHGRKRGHLMMSVFDRQVLPAIAEAQLWMVCKEEVSGKGIVWFGAMGTDREDELISLYQQAWVFCLPSSYEGFGIPYIEAMACGTAVVASPNLGAREVLVGGEFGVIASDEEIGQGLCALLTDHPRRAAMTEKGLRYVERFGLECVAGQYEAVYQAVMKGVSAT